MLLVDFKIKEQSSAAYLMMEAKKNFNLNDIKIGMDLIGVGNDVLTIKLFTCTFGNEVMYLVQVLSTSIDGNYNQQVNDFCQRIMGEMEM